MIAKFQPVKNGYGFDLREFTVTNGKPGLYNWLPIDDYKGLLGEFPILKPKINCGSKQEYLNQFINL